MIVEKYAYEIYCPNMNIWSRADGFNTLIEANIARNKNLEAYEYELKPKTRLIKIMTIEEEVNCD